MIDNILTLLLFGAAVAGAYCIYKAIMDFVDNSDWGDGA